MMRNPIYTDTKLAGALREQLKKKQEAMIKKIKPKRDSYDSYEGVWNDPTKIGAAKFTPNQNYGIYLWY